ncbi:MAG: T9SS type A sorting domain-containing protein [Saprospiraceae bacterium]
MKTFVTFLVAFLISFHLIAQNVTISGPTGVCPDSEQTYYVNGNQITPFKNQWYVSGGVFTENGSTYIEKNANLPVQITWGSTPLVGSVYVFNAQNYDDDLNVDIGTFLNIVGPSSAVPYQQIDFSAYRGDVTNLTWTISSGSVVWSNSDKTWVKIVFYGTGNKLVTLQGVDTYCGDTYTDQIYVNVSGGSVKDNDDNTSHNLSLVGESLGNANTLSVFPNPVKQYSNVSINFPAGKGIGEATKVRLISSDGRVLKEIVTANAQMNLNTSEINKGYYILQVISGKYSESVPVVIH